MNTGAFVAGQLRKPAGLMGKVFGVLMNRVNKDLNKFMLENLQLEGVDQVLEIGFGDGKLIREMASFLPKGKVVGIDFSDAMVNQARKNNKKEITQGLVEILNASIENIPFDDGRFNKACSANTLYFWPNPEQNAKEVYRILKENSQFILGFRTKQQLQNQSFTEHGFTLYTTDEVVALLKKAGFSDVEIVKSPSNMLDSYCAIASKK